MSFAPPVDLDPEQEIVERFLALYDTTDELRELFSSFFTSTSTIRDLLDIDNITDKTKLARTLVSYLGPNFLTASTGKNYNVVIKKKSENAKYLIREKLLERTCQRHVDPADKEQEILKLFNSILRSEYKNLHDLCRNKRLLNGKSRQELMKTLKFPDIVFESPPSVKQDEETTTVSKKPELKPLYDYQTQALMKIWEMLSKADMLKRKLISVPTGAGKTRLTVEAIINWINDRGMNKIPDAAPQQKNGRIIFWFASTNELCSQAASEFVNIYTQIGMNGVPFNVTRYYGSNRRDIFQILEERPGIHIVITNTEHFQSLLNEDKDKSTKFWVDHYEHNERFRKLRQQVIAIVIDEAHEAISNTYRRFLAAMGFDFNPRNIARKCNFNRNGIVLIGLTATPYRGSGRIEGSDETTEDLVQFAQFDKENDPHYFSQLDSKTKSIHKMFGGVYVPLPKKSRKDSVPVPIIEAPSYAHVGEHIKISGLKSFDNFSDIDYHWELNTFTEDLSNYDDPIFYHKFIHPGIYNIKLTVTNKNRVSETSIQQIAIYDETLRPQEDIVGTEEFIKILQDRKILCKVIYGVIDGPHLVWNEDEIRKWRRGLLSDGNEEIIENDKQYNQNICNIVHKAINKYHRNRVLIFANGVNHAHNLALILNVRYGLKAKSVDATMNLGLRRQAIREFREGKINVLCNHGILTSGFDVPEIDTLLICRTVGSNALYTQMIGRGQRGTIAGGTDNLWLITAYFKKGGFEKDLKLGWEAMATSWEKFSDTIKKDLGIRDNEGYSSKNIVSKSPPDNSKFRCETCGSAAQSISRARVLFGVEGSSEIIDQYRKDGKFPKNCRTCRDIRKIYENTKCTFCSKIIGGHMYDPILIAIALFARDQQGSGWPPKFPVLQSYLFERFHEKIPAEYFGITNASVREGERLGIMSVKGNMDVDFLHIDDVASLGNIIAAVSKSEFFKDNIASILENHEGSNTSDPTKAGPLDQIFKELLKVNGHIPTSRQFGEYVHKKNLDERFEQLYRSSYGKYLQDHHIILKDDQNLKDVLYEEYFDKCIEENTSITRKQLDRHGRYRISDYEEVFGSFSKFQDITAHDCRRLLDKVDPREHDDSEIDAIEKDLKKLQEKLQGPLHFDSIRIHSLIGSFRYLIPIKISHLRYLQRYRGNNPGRFLKLVGEFYALKRILQNTPTNKQFNELTPTVVTTYLGDLFSFDYKRFLDTLDETELEIQPDHVERMKSVVLNKLQTIQDELGSEAANKTIDSSAGCYDELSISIRAWWPDTRELKRAIERKDTV